jgi:hypothetical protein
LACANPAPASSLSSWFFTEDLVNHFSEFAVRNGSLVSRVGTGDLRLQVKHQRLHPIAAGLKFFDQNFLFPDFVSQDCRDFFFIHDVDAGVERRAVAGLVLYVCDPLNQLGAQTQEENFLVSLDFPA